MNERIRELYEQARLHAKTIPDLDPQGWMDEYHKKFAELIVQECAQAFEAEVDTWKQMHPYQGSIKRQGTKAIKQHFEVEEK